MGRAEIVGGEESPGTGAVEGVGEVVVAVFDGAVADDDFGCADANSPECDGVDVNAELGGEGVGRGVF
jgi:hypothetical protein